MAFDAISAIGRCYRSPEEPGWLASLLEELLPLSSDGVAAGVRFRVDGGRVRVEEARCTGRDPLEWIDRLDGDFPGRRRVEELLIAAAPQVALSSERLRRLPRPVAAEVRSFFQLVGAKDPLGVIARGPGQEGILLSVERPNLRLLTPRTRRLLAFFSAHLTSAIRLWAALGRDGEGEAVHRVYGARGALRLASPEEAADLWRSLLDGRWSLVEHVEFDGRRIALARRRPMEAPDATGLTPVERDVAACAASGWSNKQVAYRLGLAPSTVAEHLRSAQAKLAVRSRRELIAALGPAVERRAASRRGPRRTRQPPASQASSSSREPTPSFR
jgi:DNA-binding CsgD family transcriptional regulator